LKTFEDVSFNIKHPKKCSYTIPESPFEKNGEQWLKLGQIKSYPRQKCVQAYNKK
jgi:hypothetical protein